MTGTGARRWLLDGLLVLLALVLQAVVVARVPIPGHPPDLVLVVVLALALAQGPEAGMVAGFVAGSLVDLQADHALGRWALAYVAVARVVGELAGGDERSVLRPLVAVGLGAAGALLVYAAEGLLLGDPRVTVGAALGGLVTSAPYAVVLAPFVVPPVLALVRWLEPDPGTGARRKARW